jgi:hypothetical protein
MYYTIGLYHNGECIRINRSFTTLEHAQEYIILEIINYLIDTLEKHIETGDERIVRSLFSDGLAHDLNDVRSHLHCELGKEFLKDKQTLKYQNRYYMIIPDL